MSSHYYFWAIRIYQFYKLLTISAAYFIQFLLNLNLAYLLFLNYFKMDIADFLFQNYYVEKINMIVGCPPFDRKPINAMANCETESFFMI